MRLQTSTLRRTGSLFNRYRFGCIALLAGMLPALVIAPVPLQAQSSSPEGQEQEEEGATGNGASMYNEAYYVLDELNAGLAAPEGLVNRQTPQAALEYFLINSQNGNFMAAAHALNLNMFPDQNQAARAPVLVQQLDYILNQKQLINWATISDRPDGQGVVTPGQGSGSTGPQRSLLLGSLRLDGRDIAIRLQRVKVGNAEPVWVFSANTIENIPALYQQFGPGVLDRIMPAWAKVELPGNVPLWEWLVLLGLLLVGLIVGWMVRNLVGYGVGARWFAKKVLSRKLDYSESSWLRGLSDDIANPIALVAGLLVFSLLSQALLTLTGPFASTFNILTTVLIIIAVTWLGMRVITYFSDYIGHGYAQRLGSDDETEQRKLLTYIAVARWVLILIALFIGAGIILSQFSSLRQIGMSLLASAGVIGIIVGFAARNVLGNVIAGLQIAITQPVRIGDNVLFEGQWGYIEAITYTYLTIQTWDKRRVIVPLNYFTMHPVENWSKTSSHMIKPIYLYVDYTIDVEQIRQKFDELLRNAEKWDEETEPSVQVTGFTDETLEVRALCSAKEPTAAWNLHCRLREDLTAYVRDLEGGRYLPRRRLVWENDRPGQQNGHVREEEHAQQPAQFTGNDQEQHNGKEEAARRQQSDDDGEEMTMPPRGGKQAAEERPPNGEEEQQKPRRRGGKSEAGQRPPNGEEEQQQKKPRHRDEEEQQNADQAQEETLLHRLIQQENERHR